MTETKHVYKTDKSNYKVELCIFMALPNTLGEPIPTQVTPSPLELAL
jgi:hypothetical protein